MKYLEFVEEYKNSNMSQFDKVLIAASRARDLVEQSNAGIEIEGHKPISIAIYELNEDLIDPIITDKVDIDNDYNFDDDM